MTAPLLLTSGYRHDFGHTVSLRCRPGAVHEDLEDVLIGYSCYPPAIPKARACLTASGRYDCTLQTNWFERYAENLREELREIGIDIGVICFAKHAEGCTPRRLLRHAKEATRRWLPKDMDWTAD